MRCYINTYFGSIISNMVICKPDLFDYHWIQSLIAIPSQWYVNADLFDCHWTQSWIAIPSQRSFSHVSHTSKITEWNTLSSAKFIVFVDLCTIFLKSKCSKKKKFFFKQRKEKKNFDTWINVRIPNIIKSVFQSNVCISNSIQSCGRSLSCVWLGGGTKYRERHLQ